MGQERGNSPEYPQWEYLTARAESIRTAKDKPYLDPDFKITKEGEEIFGQEKKNFLGTWLDKEDCPSLQEYLKIKGDEGWEIAGIMPIVTGTEYRTETSFEIVFKREKT